VLSLLTLITGRIWDILRNETDVWQRRLLTVQLANIYIFMLLSAYQFLQGVRLMTHAGFSELKLFNAFNFFILILQ